MTYDPEVHQRKSIRLKGYDYALAGAYFFTVVVQGRLCLFGDVVEGEMRLNDSGRMVRRVWDGMPGRFPVIEMDAFVVMPNHVHGIVFDLQSLASLPDGAATRTFTRAPTRAPTRGAPTGRPEATGVAPRLGDVVGAFKSLTTVDYGRGVRELGWRRYDGRLWQRNYFERVIRDEAELGRAREYFVGNPRKWESDRENPAG